MKQILPVLAVLPLASCIVHVHLTKSTPTPAPAPTPAPPPPAPAEPEAEAVPASGSTSGVVLDEQGRPLRARVAAVGQGGSLASSTDAEGRFSLTETYWPVFVLHASTDDGLLAIRSGVHSGTQDLQLVARPAASATLRQDGAESVRCAVFHGDVRIEDFTLRPGEPQRVVLPAGDIHLQLYEGKDVRGERDLHLDVGQHNEVAIATGGHGR